MRLENTWQQIRDHSFIQNHSRSFRFTAPWWCFFSSVHLTHFLQGSGQRTGMAIAEAWFCAQWPIFVLVLFVYGSLSWWKIQPMPIIWFLAWTVSHSPSARGKVGEDKDLCHYFFFVIKNENKDTHYKYTQYTNKIYSVLLSGRLQ